MNRVAVKFALGCFLFGTLLLLLLLAMRADMLVAMAIAFAIFSAVVNTFLLLGLFVTLLMHRKDIEQHALAIVLVSLNYPVAALYIYFLI